MEIRPEAQKIFVSLTRQGPATETEALPQWENPDLFVSLAASASAELKRMPLTALAQACTSGDAPVISTGQTFNVSDNIVNHLSGPITAPLASEWREPLLSAVDEASESYFSAARNDFERGDTISGTENLCYAANCVVVGLATIHGWPHATDDDDINAIVALATGTLPHNADEIYELLQQAPKAGLDLSSNHGATKSMRQAAHLGYFEENGYTAELATSFARTATNLAKQLGGNPP